MGLEELWYEALKETEIVRLPIKRLMTFDVSTFEYVFLAPSLVNKGDTIVRTGKIQVDRPNLVLPKNMPSFEGFTIEETQEPITDSELATFFYARGVSFPSLQYKNEQYELDLFEGSVARAEKVYREKVQQAEKISTAIVIGVDTSWQFSVILVACHMIDSQVDADLKAILDRMRRKGDR